MTFATTTITQDDIENSARTWARIDHKDATRVPQRFAESEPRAHHEQTRGEAIDSLLPRSVIEAESIPDACSDAELESVLRGANTAPFTVGEGRFSASERAAAQGWNIDPENSPGNPHSFGVKCDDRRCSCPGKTFVAYRRGA